jgi:hypothetical protein
MTIAPSDQYGHVCVAGEGIGLPAPPHTGRRHAPHRTRASSKATVRATGSPQCVHVLQVRSLTTGRS